MSGSIASSSPPRADRLRESVVPAATAGGDAVAYVSGQTAVFKDIADQIMQRLPLFLLTSSASC